MGGAACNQSYLGRDPLQLVAELEPHLPRVQLYFGPMSSESASAPASPAGFEELLMEADLGFHWGHPAYGAGSSEEWAQSEGPHLGLGLGPVSGLYVGLWFWALEVVEVEEQAGATAW